MMRSLAFRFSHGGAGHRRAVTVVVAVMLLTLSGTSDRVWASTQGHLKGPFEISTPLPKPAKAPMHLRHHMNCEAECAPAGA